MTTNDFDPQAPYVDQKGYEYRNFAAYVAGEKLPNGRNQKIQNFWDWTSARQGSTVGQDYYDEWIWNFYVYYNEDGDPLAHNAAQSAEQESSGWLEKRLKFIPAAAERRFRAGAERHRADLVAQANSAAGRDGGPGAVQAQAAPLHPADEPEVPRGLGA